MTLVALFDRHQARLYRFALRLSGSDEEAEDLVQDAFVRAARARVPEDDEAALRWLVRVVENLARDRWRRRVVRETFARVRRSETYDPRPALDAAATVRAALASLSPRQRAIVVRHHLDGEDAAAIAATLGIAPVTVRWHLAAARKRLLAWALLTIAVIATALLVHRPAPAPPPAARHIQCTTPGGTRVVWTLDPDFHM
jgi:RNA polymerase sigma-70 factor (ECF subfamily)